MKFQIVATLALGWLGVLWVRWILWWWLRQPWVHPEAWFGRMEKFAAGARPPEPLGDGVAFDCDDFRSSPTPAAPPEPVQPVSQPGCADPDGIAGCHPWPEPMKGS